MINLEQYRAYLDKYKIVKTGHWKLTSGKHSELYVQKDMIYCNPVIFGMTVDIMTQYINATGTDDVDIITGPAIAGAVLAAPIAIDLNIQFIYPEKINNGMEFRRGYNNIILGQRVIIIEDIVTTGDSLQKVADQIVDCGGEVAGSVCIWKRDADVTFDHPHWSMIEENVDSYEPDECPLCDSNIPLMDPKTDTVIDEKSC